MSPNPRLCARARFAGALRRTLHFVTVASLLALAAVQFGVVSPSLTATAAHRVWVVSRHGHDTSSGSRHHPFATLQHAVDQAQPGDTIRVRGGTYHQAATIYTDHLTIRGVGRRPAVFDGASRVNGFTQQGSVWVKHGWNFQFDHSPSFTAGQPDGTGAWQWVNPAYPMAAWPDQVWIDGHRLAQVADASQVRRGRFAVDYTNHELIVGRNPAGRLVEASKLDKALSIRGSNVTVDGLDVVRYADSVPTLGAITIERPHTVLKHMNINRNATSGLLVSADYARILHSRINHNGLIGIHGSQAYHLRLNHDHVNGNNVQHFNQAPVAGGIKMTTTRHMWIGNSVFSHNRGTAIWTDQSVYDATIVNNRITDNTGHGVNLEISDTALVANNLIANNSYMGVQANDTGNVRIWNNDLLGNATPVNIVQDQRLASNTSWGHDPRRPYNDPTMPWLVRNEQVANNVMAMPSASADRMLNVQDATHQRSGAAMAITADGNLYGRLGRGSPRWLVVWSAGPGNPQVFDRLAQFRQQAGQEVHGRATAHALVTDTGKRLGRFTVLARGVARPLPPDVAAAIGHAGRHLGIYRSDF